MDGEDWRSPQFRDKFVKAIEVAVKDKPLVMNNRVSSDPRQLEQYIFQNSNSKEDYYQKINKLVKYAATGGQPQQQHPGQGAPYDMNAPQRLGGGPMMGGAPNDPMQQQQPTQSNATISTGPLPPQQPHHYGSVDAQGRLLPPPPNPYAQQPQMQNQMNMRSGPGGPVLMNVPGQNQQHMMQQQPQHRMIARQAAPGMRMAPGGPAQPVMMQDGQRYAMPPQERPGEFLQHNQPARFTRAPMSAQVMQQHQMQQPPHWATTGNAGSGGGGPAGNAAQMNEAVIVTHFGPTPIRPQPPMMTRADLNANAGNVYQSQQMQQAYGGPRAAMNMQQQGQPGQQQVPSGMNIIPPGGVARFDQPVRMQQTAQNYQRHLAPVPQQPSVGNAGVPPPGPVMGPPSVPMSSSASGPYIPTPSPNTAPMHTGPGPSPAPPGQSGLGNHPDASPVYASNSIGSVGNRHNIPTEPSPANQTQSDAALMEDPGYRDKIQELQVYLDPLKRMLEQQQKDGDKNSLQSQKLLKIIDIIEGKSKATLDLLLKCEDTLKKIVLKEAPKLQTKDSTLCQPLFDVVVPLAKAHNANQILKRVFEATSIDFSKAKRLCAPKYPDDPTPRSIEANFALKMAEWGFDSASGLSMKKESAVKTDSSKVPASIQREVASLETRFRIVFDRGLAADALSATKTDVPRIIHVVCDLEDRRLPHVPSLRLQIPNDYPASCPKYDYELADYCGSPFLDQLRERLINRLTKLGSNCSITSLLDNWESTVRQACLSQ